MSVISRKDPKNKKFREVYDISLYEYPAPCESSRKLSFVYEYVYSLLASFLFATWSFVRDGFAVVQTGDPPDIQFFLAAPFKALGRAFVVDQRDLSPEVYRERYGVEGGAILGILRTFERWSWRVADDVLCVNGSLRDVIVDRGRIRPDRVTIVGNGPELAAVSPRPARAELKQGRRFLACWVGLMGPQDRVDVAIRVVDEVVHGLDRSDCQFVIIGEGETLELSKDLALQLGLTEYVTFTGWMEEENLFTYLSTADVGLESNLQADVTPVKGLEYMAFGLPFVAFDLKETREMAEEAAEFVRPGDVPGFARAIADLLDDPDRRAEMGRRGRSRIERELAWDHQKKRYVALYERLIDRMIRH